MIFARIGHGSCYYHWNEIFAGVYTVSGELEDVTFKISEGSDKN